MNPRQAVTVLGVPHHDRARDVRHLNAVAAAVAGVAGCPPLLYCCFHSSAAFMMRSRDESRASASPGGRPRSTSTSSPDTCRREARGRGRTDGRSPRQAVSRTVSTPHGAQGHPGRLKDRTLLRYGFTPSMRLRRSWVVSGEPAVHCRGPATVRRPPGRPQSRRGEVAGRSPFAVLHPAMPRKRYATNHATPIELEPHSISAGNGGL